MKTICPPSRDTLAALIYALRVAAGEYACMAQVIASCKDADVFFAQSQPQPANTVLINGVVCPAPLRVRPKEDDRYWIAYPGDKKGAACVTWRNRQYDKNYFLAGQCFATEGHARQHYEAQIKPTRMEP